MKKGLFAVFMLLLMFQACKKKEGCTYPEATNYDSAAEKDDGSCKYASTTDTIIADTSNNEKCTYTLSYITDTALTSYTALNGDVYSSSGTYQVIIPNVAGCDSVITIKLTVTQLAVIGDFRDGGIVFWEDGKGGGLVCAITDQSSAIQWYNSVDVWTGANGSGIGSGLTNTLEIIKDQGATETDYAAGIANTYRGGGYSDWFLPSKLELTEIYNNKDIVNSTAIAHSGDVLGNFYWSSTEYNTDWAYFLVFPAGISQNHSKASTSAVRAVRAF